MFDNLTTTTSAAVADNGTFTVGYPAGKSAATYAGAHKHLMFAMGAKFVAPTGFTLTFGASEITVTYLGSTTIPAGTAVRLQVDRLGTDSGDPNAAVVNDRLVKAPLRLFDLGSPGTADADGVAASQSVGAGASFVINGALADSGKVIFDTPRNVVAAWTTTSVLTITGTDVDGNAMVEKSASGASHTGKKAFKTVTGVSSSAAITSATVGSGTVLGLPAYVPGASYVVAEFESGVLKSRKPGKMYITASVLCSDDTVGVFRAPCAGTISKISTIERAGGITMNDAVLTFKIGTTAITNGAVTIATSGSAAGVIDTVSPTAANVLAAGDAVNCVVSGTPGAATTATVVFEIDVAPSAVMAGTFVAGVTDAATATTGDTRGTYAPETTPNGTVAYALAVMMPGPDDQGVAQYAG